MKVCVFGAGAIGGVLAARLAAAGSEVSVVARGRQLDAIATRGLTLVEDGKRWTVPVRASSKAAELGPQDVVVIATKAHSLAASREAIDALIGPDTVLVPAQNGIPWWYFFKEGGRFDGERVAAVDPDGALWRALAPHRVVGCVVYIGAEVIEPGVIVPSAGRRFILGEPDGSASRRLEGIAASWREAGFDIETTPRIREAIWVKLWGNLAMNPISVLTHATMDRMIGDPGVNRVLRGLMEEGQRVGEALGIDFGTDVPTRIKMAARLGAFRTSMLQDLDAGRPLEVDALLGAVTEIGSRLGVPTPLVDTVYALARLRGTRA
jgi:2-dehydropantoate 2-reductase